MKLDSRICYQALRRRDRRFDGRFFTGVVTTGVYCRPVCPAPLPKLENVRFFVCSAAAESAGFRPCRRCRPETAPGTPAWIGSAAVVSRALRLISDDALDEGAVDDLAARLGIGARQLRRLFAKHLGASPAEIARARRVHFARTLADETALPMAEVALAAGFRSVRQFNHAVRSAFGRTPSELRNSRGRALETGVALRLRYRPPFDWQAMLEFLRLRAIPGVEVVDRDVYKRTLEIHGARGTIEVGCPADASHLVVRIDLDRHQELFRVAQRARRFFDLDADPIEITRRLGMSKRLARRVRARPGLRVPGAWDGFELAVRAILGQQVTVRGATTLAGRLVESFGEPLPSAVEGLTHFFPRPEVLARADLSTLGVPAARRATLRALASAVASGELALDASRPLEETVERLCRIPGIGEWTAHYVAMRALGEPDAFPAGDLGLRRALGNGRGPIAANELARLAEEWRPWRAYAVMHLWTAEASNP